MDEIEIDRKRLTFAQAEGASPLPQQQNLKEISKETRAAIWLVIFNSVSFFNRKVSGRWEDILLRWHVVRDHEPVDDFDGGQVQVIARLKKRIFDGSYIDVFDFLQFVVRQKEIQSHFGDAIAHVLTQTRCAYRLIGGDTFSPIQSQADADTLSRAFQSASGHEGALQHLRNAAAAATAGSWAECIVQSIHSVEATAKSLASKSSTLKPALDELEKHHQIHGALKQGFLRIYDFTSDEKGIRHSLLEKSAADVDEIDALFMLGACAAFVSYLVGKGRVAGIV